MTYHINEVFLTLQGEGYWTGRAAVFCRFSRCNLWTGYEKDRDRAICQFCDTDFTDSTSYFDACELADAIVGEWVADPDDLPPRDPMVVFTGGEALLELDQPLTHAMHAAGFYIAVETNGTRLRPRGIDWLCMSPKTGTELAITSGDELKLIYPQNIDPSTYLGLDFTHWFLQPMAGPTIAANTQQAIDYIKTHPQWRLSLQTHKLAGIP